MEQGSDHRSRDGEGSAVAVLHAVRDLSVAVDRLRDDLAHEYNITVHDTVVLTALNEAGRALRPVEIAARLATSSGTLTAMLDRLEAARFIVREANPHDRRSTMIDIAPEARSLLGAGRRRLLATIDAALPEDQRVAVAAAMRALAVAMTDMGGLLPRAEQQLASEPPPASGSE